MWGESRQERQRQRRGGRIESRGEGGRVVEGGGRGCGACVQGGVNRHRQSTPQGTGV